MQGEIYYRREDGEPVWRPFPTLRTNTFDEVLSSGLWDYGNRADRAFLDTARNYEKKAAYANLRFRGYEQSLSEVGPLNERVKKTKELRELAHRMDWFKSFDSMQTEMGRLIWSEYPWAIRTQLPEAYEQLQQTFQQPPPSDGDSGQ